MNDSTITIIVVVVALIGLALLYFLSNTKKAKVEAPVENAQSEVAQVDVVIPKDAAYGGTLKLHNVDDQTAAMIMAIISDTSGIPLSELCFKSIRLITE